MGHELRHTPFFTYTPEPLSPGRAGAALNADQDWAVERR